VTHTHKNKVPQELYTQADSRNAERFITPELKEIWRKILHAEEKILSLETRLFNELRQLIAEHASTIQTDAYEIAT